MPSALMEPEVLASGVLRMETASEVSERVDVFVVDASDEGGVVKQIAELSGGTGEIVLMELKRRDGA